jgi:hypothetical protein
MIINVLLHVNNERCKVLVITKFNGFKTSHL